jgi:glycosyltransferase involved in cell wall biosynthesis
MTTSTTVLLPAYNEEKSIAAVIKDIQTYLKCNIVVAASHCTDNTVAIARKCGSEVIMGPRGKGRAVAFALKQIDSDHVIMLDSDLTYPAKYIPIMVDMLQFNDAVLGIRDFNKSNMPRMNSWGNNFITKQAQLLYGYPIHDLCTGMWAFNSNVIKGFNIESYGFTLEAEIFIYLIKHKYSIGQVTIDYYPRVGDRKINRLDHLKIMWYLWSRRFK